MKFFDILVTLIVVLSSTEASDKLQVGIYIESMCGYSKQFITSNFRQAYDSIKDDTEITFYTHGKSSSFIDDEGNIVFTCQHGAQECFLNRVQTCALQRIGRNQDLQVAFIICAMGDRNTYEQCVEEAGLDQQDIEDCATGPSGIPLQLEMEKASAAVIGNSTHVPTITFDGKYVEEEFGRSLSDFKGIVKEKRHS